MKKISICAILVIILSLCVACQDNNTKISNEDLAAKFASAYSQTASTAKPDEAATPVPDTQPTDAIDRPEPVLCTDEPKQPPYMTASPALAFNADTIAGWWVYMGEDADAEVPIVYYFTEDGYVFLWPEAYYDSYAGNEVFCCEWEMREGKPVYLDIDGLGEREAVACDILYEGEDAMSILWPDGVKSFFMRNTTQKASRFLKKGEYDYLAKAPVYCRAYFGKYLDQTCYTIMIDDIAYVTPEDTDLIAEYHLENAPFDNALELYNEDSTLYPMQAFTDGSTVFSIVRMLNGRIIRTQVSAEQFIEFIYPDNLRLFTVTANEGYIEEIAEVYLPYCRYGEPLLQRYRSKK